MEISKAEQLATTEFGTDYVNPRGIPRMPFVENVEEFVKAKAMIPDTIIRQFQEHYSKYKLMETKLSQTRSVLSAKIPEVQRTIELIETLKKKMEAGETTTTHFGLTESVFCEATVPPQKTVHLWLGAQVMVEFPFDEALQLLRKNLDSAAMNLTHTIEDLAWLRDQITVCEVNTSRVYNFDVIRRREEKERERTS